MKKVLITGGSGFIGTHLSKFLISKNYDVSVIDIIKPDFPISGVKYYLADVRSKKEIEEYVSSVDVIFHFAAIVSVPLCEEKIIDSYNTNFSGTLNILEIMAENSRAHKKVPLFIFASSAAVYGDSSSPNISVCETNLLPLPKSFYCAQKVSSEHAIRIFSNKFAIPALIFRFFNVYGPNQKIDSQYSGVISIFMRALKNGENLKIHGDGMQTRDFVSVYDVIRACYLVLHELDTKECNGDVINIGSGHSITILELAQKVQEIGGRKVQIEYTPPRVGDVKYSQADVSLAKSKINWEPKIEFVDGLKELFETLCPH